jgi:hypothetical protein
MDPSHDSASKKQKLKMLLETQKAIKDINLLLVETGNQLNPAKTKLADYGAYKSTPATTMVHE